jgi:hypothetical protein
MSASMTSALFCMGDKVLAKLCAKLFAAGTHVIEQHFLVVDVKVDNRSATETGTEKAEQRGFEQRRRTA